MPSLTDVSPRQLRSPARNFNTFVGFSAALLILAGIAVTTYRTTRQALEDNRRVAHTHQVLGKLHELLVVIADFESDARGYVITGDPTFLASYQHTVTELPTRLEEVLSLISDHPAQRERLAALKPIVDAKVAFSSELLKARRDRGMQGAQALVISEVGKDLMNSIHSIVGAMEAEEQALLGARIQRDERSESAALTVIVLGNLLAGAILGGAITVTYRENARRRVAERAALAERKRLDLIVSNLGEGVVAADKEGNITLVNASAEHLIGPSAPATIREWLAAGPKLLQADEKAPYPAEELPLVRALGGESCDDVEILVRDPRSPQDAIIAVTGRPIRDDAGGLLGGVIVIRDITQRKRHEDEIQRKSDELVHAYAELDRTRLDQLHTKDQLLSHVSHELRTPLTAAYQFVEILCDGIAGPLTPEQIEYSEIALRNLKQLRAMIGDLLDATRLESAKLTIDSARVNLSGIASEVCRSLYSPAAEKGIALENRVGSLPDAFADAVRVRQILANLVQNAIKFTDSGTVTIEASVFDRDPRLICISVSDTGCGMSPEVASRVFTRLYQAGGLQPESRHGLGLGLYICRELVIRQGGKIWVESEPGVGSTFSWTLPIYSEAIHVTRVVRDDEQGNSDH